MAKVFSFNPELWNFADQVSGNLLTYSWSLKNVRLGNWYAVNSLAQDWHATGWTISLAWDFTMYCGFYWRGFKSSASSANILFTLWSFWGGWGWFWFTINSSNNMQFFQLLPLINRTFTSTNIKDWRWHFISVKRVWTTLTYIIDWVSQWVTNTSSYAPNLTVRILWDSNIYRWFNWSVNLAEMHNTALSDTQIKSIYKAWLNRQPLLEKKTNFVYPKPTTLTEPWLVGAWNMKPNGRTLVDISGNWNNGTIVWAYPNKEWMVFDWINDYVFVSDNVSLDITSNVTLMARIKLNSFSWDMSIIEKGNAIPNINYSMRVNWWKLRFIIFNVWYNTSQSNDIVITTWVPHTLCITYNNTSCKMLVNWILVASSFVSGSAKTMLQNNNYLAISKAWENNSWYINWEVIETRVYNRVLTDQEIKNYHNKWARQIVFKETFAYDKADWNTVVTQGWISFTWSSKLVTNTATNAIVKKWEKYYESINQHNYAYPLQQAYWTFEFNVYKIAWNEIRVSFINWTVRMLFSASYTFFFNVDNRLMLFKDWAIWADLFWYTNKNYLANSTRYRIRITRTTTWVFTVYVKWWAFADYTLVSTAWWNGTNPVTNNVNTVSKSFAVQPSTWAWNRISNIVIKQWVEV